jgi:hypothetical protein
MRDDLTDYPARKYDLMMLKMDQTRFEGIRKLQQALPSCEIRR